MKKLFFLFLLSLILIACGPSDEAIQTALAETETAKPTETVTPSPSPTNTVTPSPTNTPTETPTVTSSLTSTPEVPLDELIIRYEDIRSAHDELSTMWMPSPITVECPFNFNVDIDVALDCHAITYLPDISWAEPLTIQVTRIDGDQKITQTFRDQTKQSLLQNGISITAPPKVFLPEHTWIVEVDDALFMGATQENIFWIIVYDIWAGMDGDTLSGHLSVLGQKQMEILKENGYK